MLLFVYGTLRRGQPAHGLLAGAHLVAQIGSSDGWELLDLGRYPAATLGRGRILGELYQIDQACLARLDDYEGRDYARITMQTELGPAWIYRYRKPPSRASRVPGGDWSSYVRQSLLYFAYGSNMATARLQGRIGSARPVMNAWLGNQSLVFAKPGQDGTAKCSFEPRPGQKLHGVLFRIAAGEKTRLDEIEGSGYDSRWFVLGSAYGQQRAFGYRAKARVEDWQPSQDYVDWVCRGAVEHRLPEAYCRNLGQLVAAHGRQSELNRLSD